jgi:hypothetical protein
MAHLSFAVAPAGLIVPVWIGLSRPRTTACIASGQPVPAPLGARALLDTGTDVTAIASSILRRLPLGAPGTLLTHTASGPVSVDVYRVSVGITDPTQPTGSPWLMHSDQMVTELTTVLPDADVLIGLDILLECRLVLDGPARQFTIDF